MTASLTISPTLGRDPALLPGDLDRTILAAGVTFALDSLRHGSEEAPGPAGVDAQGQPLLWRQATWIEDAWFDAIDVGSAVFEEDDPGVECGTGCCLAGWIDLAGHRFDRRAAERDQGSVRGRAVEALTGWSGYWDPDDEELKASLYPGLPEDLSLRRLHTVIDDLFAGSNEIDDVVAVADELLRLYGQPELVLDPGGTFS